MSRPIPPPKTIAERGGLEVYLNDTAELHNGLKYKDLIKRLDPGRKHKIPKSVIAEDFNVTKQTIYQWLKKISIFPQE